MIIPCEKTQVTMSKDNDYIKLIHSKRWLALRRDYLTRHPLCERCRENDRLRTATEVHHKIPIESGHCYNEKSRLAYDPTNLMALCRECHINEHRAMHSCSQEEAGRRATAHRDWFKRTFID